MMLISKPPYILRILLKGLVWRLPEKEKNLFLTFDDGPHPEITTWVLETLKNHNAKATFFLVGENACKNPDLVRRIVAEGHSIGNHTFNHLNGWKTKTPVYIKNIKEAGKNVKSNLFRPPYGRLTLKQIRKLSPEFKIIMWDVLSRDYDHKITSDKCRDIVIKNSKNGSVIVFHDSKKAEKNLRKVLPEILRFFINNGYSFKAIPFSDF